MVTPCSYPIQIAVIIKAGKSCEEWLNHLFLNSFIGLEGVWFSLPIIPSRK